MQPPDNPSSNRAASQILWMLSLLPALAIVLFYACVLHARLLLGFWPAPGYPDSKSIELSAFGIHRSLIFALVMVTSASPTVWLLTLPMSERLISLRSYLIRLTVYLVSLAAFLVLCRIDPGNFISWFVD